MSITTALAYIIWDADPDIFIIPFINHPVRWYGLLFALAFVLSQQLMYLIYKREGRPVAEIDTLTVYMVVATIVGARLGHIVFYNPDFYLQNPLKILMIWEGGLASHGGVIAILIAIYLFARKTRVDYLWALDRISIVAALSFSMIRLGNLMNSEMIGKPSELPWAFIFTTVDDVPRHPAQLYEAVHYFLWFVVLYALWSRNRAHLKDGLLFSWSMIVLFSFRFIDEFFKLNQEQFEDEWILNMGQLLSIPFILVGVVLWLFIARRNKVQATAVDGALNTGTLGTS